ncbi:MAG: NAD(P)H-hydrate dehydratase [Oscillospiraceae bacterium]|jgi:NAD(P)H-hydrate epimerase|nr:NAD(P)H-hydrate dehydratase [Oscillospiraceae bacterium]
MLFTVTTEQMKSAETAAARRGILPERLAENAACACFERISSLAGGGRGKTFTVLCGRGLNGGDGIIIADLAKKAGGESLCVFAAGMPSKDAAREIYSRYAPGLVSTIYSPESENTVKTALLNSHVIVDCVFGTGFSGELDTGVAELFKFVNDSCRAFKVSVDVPSGINADTGERASYSFIPNVTLVLGAYKKWQLSHPCRDYCGDTALMDIGLIREDFSGFEARFTDEGIMSCRPRRRKTAHKGDFGRLLNISGSERCIGAALLSTKAALRAGAGAATLVSPRQTAFAVAAGCAEATFIPVEADKDGFMGDGAIRAFKDDLQKATAVLIGCGLGNTSVTKKIVEFVINETSRPTVLDADALNAAADNLSVLKGGDNLILTPHPAEFSRVSGLGVDDIQKDRIGNAKKFAKEYGVTLVLKGVNTVIAAPDGRVAVNPTGNAGLAKAGSGDVLAGVIASLAAQGVKPFEAAALGAYMHGLAAQKVLGAGRSLAGMTAGDVADMIGCM